MILHSSTRGYSTISATSAACINNQSASETSVSSKDADSAIDDEDWVDATPSRAGSAVESTIMFKRVKPQRELMLRSSDLTKSIQNENIANTTSGTRNSTSYSLPLPHQRSAAPNQNYEDDLEVGPLSLEIKSRSRPLGTTSQNSIFVAHSPHTTKQNMLDAELPESLRLSLFRERQVNSSVWAVPNGSLAS